ncbi:MAG: hypothetical protein JW809_04425 [Pirellulales bacterium]|nr:hypothetical protein [Pirellulales bacterium]
MATQRDVEKDPHEFVFELDLAIREQVLAKLSASPKLALEKDIGPRASGVYVIYWKGALVYVGKASQATTSSKRTLRARLNEHLWNQSGFGSKTPGKGRPGTDRVSSWDKQFPPK